MEEGLLRAFDALIAKKGYGNRSEAIRDLVREALNAQTWEGGETVLGVLSLLYEHRKRGVVSRLTAAQHHAHALVLATLHIHVDEERCLEVIALKGSAQEIQKLADRLRAEPGVLLGHLARIGQMTAQDLPHGLGSHPVRE